MALPKKNSRKITVGEVDYRWTESVTILDDGNCRVNLTIESMLATAKRIYATCVSRCDSPGDREKLTTPANVAAVIQHVVKNGWKPASATATATDDCRIADFLFGCQDDRQSVVYAPSTTG